MANHTWQSAQCGQLLRQCLVVDHAAVFRRLKRENSQGRQLARKGLGRGYANFDTCQNRQRQIAFAGNRAGGNVHDRQDFRRFAFHVAQGGQSIGCLARLADKQGNSALGHRRFTVAEFRGHIDLDGHACDLLEPVFRDVTGIKRGATGHHRHALNFGKVDAAIRQHNIGAICVDVMGEGALQHRRLFGDFLGHKVLEATFVG